MKLKKYFLFFVFLFLFSCVEHSQNKTFVNQTNLFYSKGFALIYSDQNYYDKIVNRKIDNTKIFVGHSKLKKNTLIKIINPINSKVLNLKISKNLIYPKVFNIVISKKVAASLELDLENPYVEIFEQKKNKTFVAKESNIFDEEKNVANSAPVDKVKMDDLSIKDKTKKDIVSKKNNFYLIISDFYYLESAKRLKVDLTKKIDINNFLIKKINTNKFRLKVGPFTNFNSLKDSYIKLTNLGFEDLNVHNE
tara:strand:+ start:374 stop:1123 length:750 start_codon:yes stop_codon:yes gene_type:complete